MEKAIEIVENKLSVVEGIINSLEDSSSVDSFFFAEIYTTRCFKGIKIGAKSKINIMTHEEIFNKYLEDECPICDCYVDGDSFYSHVENKEILPEDIWSDEKRESIKKAIKAHEWMPFEHYLLWVGEKSVDYSYTINVIFEHLEYFRRGWLNHTNPYYMLEMFSFELGDKIEKE